MSISYERGNIIFQCDQPGCRASLRTETSNFGAALNLLRRRQWQPVKVKSRGAQVASDLWGHRCAEHIQQQAML